MRHRLSKCLRRVSGLRPLTPALFSVSFSAEWLLGNHSDELTPWLPLLASTHPSGQQKFWVLPCCPFDIDGSRYSRRISDEGPHASYLLHIFQVRKTEVERGRARGNKDVALICQRIELSSRIHPCLFFFL